MINLPESFSGKADCNEKDWILYENASFSLGLRISEYYFRNSKRTAVRKIHSKLYIYSKRLLSEIYTICWQSSSFGECIKETKERLPKVIELLSIFLKDLILFERELTRNIQGEK